VRVSGAKPNFFSLLRFEEALMRLLHYTVCVGGPFQIASGVYTDELEAFDLIHCGPEDVNRGVLPLLFPELHNQLPRFC
jgi:hypothetical protein